MRAITDGVVETLPAIFLATLTTVLAFASLRIVGSPTLSDLAVVGGLGLVLTLLAVIVAVPVTSRLLLRDGAPTRPLVPFSHVSRFATRLLPHRKPVAPRGARPARRPRDRPDPHHRRVQRDRPRAPPFRAAPGSRRAEPETAGQRPALRRRRDRRPDRADDGRRPRPAAGRQHRGLRRPARRCPTAPKTCPSTTPPSGVSSAPITPPSPCRCRRG